MSRPISSADRTLNGPADNKALKHRGSLTIWFDPDLSWAAPPAGNRGRPAVYRDAAVQTCLTMKVLFGMALRRTTGFIKSLLQLVNLDGAVPGFSTLNRRQQAPKVNIPYRSSAGPLHLLIDTEPERATGSSEPASGLRRVSKQSTGLLARRRRKHGGTKRRVWHKLHIGIDAQTPDIRAAEFTTRDGGDAPLLPELLDQIPLDQEIASVTADGAFDTRTCHDAIAARGAAAILPPCKNAKPRTPDTPRAIARNEAPRASRRFGRPIWRR